MPPFFLMKSWANIAGANIAGLGKYCWIGQILLDSSPGRKKY